MSITQTPDAGWSFVHQGHRYTYPTRELAREALYDLAHDRKPTAAIDAALGEALEKVDEQDRPFCLAITEWLDRVPESHRGYATAGLLLIEIACEADEDLAALDEDQQLALGAYAQGWNAGRDDLMTHIEARARYYKEEQQKADAEARRAA
jgi:hypothetical protein